MIRRLVDTLLLLAATLLGAWLRLRGLAVPSFWFDEIYHYKQATQAAHQAWWRWLTIFEIENGPLFYAGQLLGRLSHSPEFSARILPALCGIAAIPLLWFAARKNRSTVCAAVVLMAVSPLAVYYSREARPYALVVMVTAGLIAAMLQSSFGLFVALLVVAFYSGAMMAPVVASVVIAGFGKERRWWIAAAACALLIAICYHPGSYPRDMPVAMNAAGDIRGVLDSFSVAAVETSRPHLGAYAFLALAIAGAIALLRRDWREGLVVTAIGLLPVAIGLTATWLIHRPFGVRYVIGGLPGYLLLVAAGIAWLTSSLGRWRLEAIAAIVIAALLAREGWNAAIEEPFQKLDWRAVARAIDLHARDKDTVIAADVWTREQIGFYLSPRLNLVDAGRQRENGEIFAYQHTTSWLVVGDASSEFAQWACRFPVLLGSPLQDFRLHYCPNPYYFLTDRSTAPEHRALLATFDGPPSLSFGPGDDVLLGDGWSSAERDGDHFARWAIGRRAFLALPVRADGPSAMTIDVLPVLQGTQKVTVNINDAPVASLILEPRRRTYAMLGTFRKGINILRFDFDHTVVPAEVDPRTSDRRQLAARFFGLSVGAGFSKPVSHLLRLDEGTTYLDETSTWRTRGGRALPPNIDRVKLSRFLGRLGLDPGRATDALLSRRVTLADLAATIADDSACIDDRQFLDRLFRAILDREIGAGEAQSFSRDLQRGVQRWDIAWRLGNSDEVRKQITR